VTNLWKGKKRDNRGSLLEIKGKNKGQHTITHVLVRYTIGCI